MFSVISFIVSALLPCAPLLMQTRGTQRKTFTKPIVQVLLSLSILIDLQGRAARHRVVQEVLLEEQGAERGAPLPEGPPQGGRGRAGVRKGDLI